MVRKGRQNSLRYGSGLISSITGAAGALLNKAIDILPVEIHLPGYQYCGPGTNLQKRLTRGDSGINKLDTACKAHDIAYSKFQDSKSRSVADKILAERAWERVKAPDSSLGERAAAWTVTNIMKAKTAFGGGLTTKKTCKCLKVKNKLKNNKKNAKKKSRKIKKSRKNNNNKKGKGLYLKPYVGAGSKKKQRHTHQK